MPKLRFRHPFIALMLLVSMLCQGTWALAGTTGALTGTVVLAESNSPIAGAKVTAASPSQVATATTDAQGHFAFVSLAPDAYTVSVEKEGYQSVSQTGIAVFADNTQTVTISLLKVIGKVTTRAASALVKPGTTADVYSVDANTASKVAVLGGGGSLDQAYSAVASVPGVYVPAGASGWNQTVLIRGGDYDQVGFEFDGVPVNRSFDNYPANTASALGQQELQVYTGSSPANAESTGLAGFINQVIKTGTYPGFASADLGIGGPTFYHKANFEIGGANPSRNFSYYVGFGGYNQDFRYYDQNNGGGLSAIYGTPFDVAGCPGGANAANYAACYAATQNGSAPFGTPVGPGGYIYGPYNAGSLTAHIQDRESVVNLHFGLPHKKDAGKDDIQLLYDVSSLYTWAYDSPLDWGPTSFYTQTDANGLLRGGSLPTFPGPSWTYSGPMGQALPTNPSQIASQISAYHFPFQDNPNDPNIPLTKRGGFINDDAIVKLQYQHNIGSSAYFRIYGYSFYSDWLNNDPNATNAFGIGIIPSYELDTHTRGLSASYVSQINAKNLLSLQASTTVSSVVRYNNSTYYTAGRTFGLVVDSTNPNSGICFNTTVGPAAAPVSCYSSSATGVALPGGKTSGTSPSDPAFLAQFTNAIPAGTTCNGHPCELLAVENGLNGTLNTVKPIFGAYSITDQWKPTDRLLLNLGLREETYEFKGADTSTGARTFWFNAWNNSYCINANAPGSGPVKNYTKTGTIQPCSSLGAGYAPATLSNAPVDNKYSEFEPRISGTYTLNPDNVLRFSYGRYSQPGDSAAEQYNVAQQNLPKFIGPTFLPYGFNSTGHNIPPEVSNNYDFSWEHQVKNSDWAWKITPFYRNTQGEQTAFFIDPVHAFVSNIPVGNLTSKGVELSVRKGDFNRDGWAGQLSYTYTYTTINYTTLGNGGTPLSPINNDITLYNAFTSYCSTHASDARCGGGKPVIDPNTGTAVVAAPCYTTAGAPDPTCNPTSVANPYWNAQPQGLFNLNGPYYPTDTVVSVLGLGSNTYGVPHTATLILNYKHGKWAFTPSFQFAAGQRYGTPESVPGVDPTTCTGTLGSAAGGDPRNPGSNTGGSLYDATTCGGVLNAIPDPYTNHFDNIGEFVAPSQLLGHLLISYEASPRVTFQLTLANLINSCFGGSKEAWTSLGNNKACSYTGVASAGIINPAGNIYNPGAAIQAPLQYPYQPYFGVYNPDGQAPMSPFNAYFDVKIKL